MKPVIAFVVNGGDMSPMGQRAREFAKRLSAFDVHCLFRSSRKGAAALRFGLELRDIRPELCCVFDHAFDGVLSTAMYSQAHRIPWILDTGDDIVALGRALQRGSVSQSATRWLDRFGETKADHVVVRGRGHADRYLARGIDTTWIPDGVDVAQFAPTRQPNEPSASNPLVIGLVGSSRWTAADRMCYGQDLVEVVCDLLDRAGFPFPVQGVMIGDGSGIPVLQQILRDRGREHAVTFLGRRNYDELPALLATMHICLSTQTDDDVGAVRTTGKLPIYLAAGRFILASRVGEAARVLPDSMLVPYDGTFDTRYPAKVADRIRDLVRAETLFSNRVECTAIARSLFDYDVLAKRYGALIAKLLTARL